MNGMLNRFIFSEINLDSGSLGVLTSVIHKFPEEGAYNATILRGSEAVGRFSILVGESPQRTTELRQQQRYTQIHVDLKAPDLSLAQVAENRTDNRFLLERDGYAVFHISTGAGGYRVEVYKTGKEGNNAAKAFDSRELRDDDLFVATVLRPGSYSITNVTNKARAELRVLYPEIGKIPRIPEPVSLECTQKAIEPHKIQISPTQPLIFKFQIPSRIKIELVKPDDRPRLVKPLEKVIAPRTKAAKQEAEAPREKKVLRRIRYGASASPQQA
jgi:hypothetical protein